MSIGGDTGTLAALPLIWESRKDRTQFVGLAKKMISKQLFWGQITPMVNHFSDKRLVQCVGNYGIEIASNIE